MCLQGSADITQRYPPQVELALKHLSRPGALEVVWVLGSHTVLALVAPFYGGASAPGSWHLHRPLCLLQHAGSEGCSDM